MNTSPILRAFACSCQCINIHLTSIALDLRYILTFMALNKEMVSRLDEKEYLSLIRINPIKKQKHVVNMNN